MDTQRLESQTVQVSVPDRTHHLDLGEGFSSMVSGKPAQWRCRKGPAGVHLFHRETGLNVLFDEIIVPSSQYSRAPRQVSIALTNRCDLACEHCYAPKTRVELPLDRVTAWLDELDKHGTLAIGFGGGEPTLYPKFATLCRYAAEKTGLSVSFTTHGHHIDEELADSLRGSVHFIRVSMDGVGTTYESIRRRSFRDLLSRLGNIRSISRFGVNVVINDQTFPELDEVARIAADTGASELLLLPQIPIQGKPGISGQTMQQLRQWAFGYLGPLKLSVNESSSEGFPTCDPMASERGLRSYVHIDATGVLKPNSYSPSGVQMGLGSVLPALDQLQYHLKETK